MKKKGEMNVNKKIPFERLVLVYTVYIAYRVCLLLLRLVRDYLTVAMAAPAVGYFPFSPV
jgi:hypothetical protein